MAYISEHFTDDEFRCKCCGGLPSASRLKKLVERAERIRSVCGNAPMTIHCAYRCEKHNAEVGGEPNSQHLLGTAADVDASEFGVEKLAKWFEELGADGVGRYDNFVHVDTRSGRIGDNFRW